MKKLKENFPECEMSESWDELTAELPNASKLKIMEAAIDKSSFQITYSTAIHVGCGVAESIARGNGRNIDGFAQRVRDNKDAQRIMYLCARKREAQFGNVDPELQLGGFLIAAAYGTYQDNKNNLVGSDSDSGRLPRVEQVRSRKGPSEML